MKIILIGRIAVLLKDLVEKQLRCDCEISVIEDASEVTERLDLIRAADVIVGWPLTAEIASNAHRVRLLQVAGAGVDGLPFELLRPGVSVANTFHHETSIAEHIVMAMLVLTRRPAEYDARLRTGDWWDSCIWGEPPNLSVLDGRTALFLGLGHIASETARRTRAFGLHNIGVSRSPGKDLPSFDRIVGYDHWRDELPGADFVVPCCPLTSGTEGLIGAPEFALMQRGACLINTARGPVVEEKALYEALRDHRIAGAAIDVWYRYPADAGERCLPSDYPFHELPNVLMTPHVSGWTERTVEGRMTDIAENINRLADGRPLINVVYSTPR
jgi:phosphoglycerate dehydrogenase-like enzyme